MINADGSALKTFPALRINVGIAWSPDGRFIVGRASTPTSVPPELTIIRVSDGAAVPLIFVRPVDGAPVDYLQPDWR